MLGRLVGGAHILTVLLHEHVATELGIVASLVEGHLDIVVQLVQLLCQGLYSRTVLSGGAEQAVTLTHNGVVLGDELGYRSVGNVGRHHLVFVGGRADGVTQVVDEHELHVHLVHGTLGLVGILGGFLHRGLHLAEGLTVAVALDGALGTAQLTADLRDTVVDELLGAHSHLVLVLVGLTVVAGHDLTEVIDGALGKIIHDRHIEDGGPFCLNHI